MILSSPQPMSSNVAELNLVVRVGWQMKLKEPLGVHTPADHAYNEPTCLELGCAPEATAVLLV